MYHQSALSLAARILCFKLLLLLLLIVNVTCILVEKGATTIDQFPEIVQLSDRNFRLHECGGFLVSPIHVVTAAHCITHKGKYLRVFANTTSSTEGGLERFIVDTYIPDAYNRKTKDWDVAVLKLNKPLPLGKGIRIATLCKKRWVKQGRLRIAGWGSTMRNEPLASSSTLNTAIVQTISDVKCKERLSYIQHGNKTKKFKLGDTMSCALAKGHVDACLGDSGGPGYMFGEVCGIVSWGFECGRGKLPSIYTSIPKVREFIDKAMAR